jgi:hypothetical protein
MNYIYLYTYMILNYEIVINENNIIFKGYEFVRDFL